MKENFSLNDLTNRLNHIAFSEYDDDSCENCVFMRYLPTNEFLSYFQEDDEVFLDEHSINSYLPKIIAISLAKRIDPNMSNWEVYDMDWEEIYISDLLFQAGSK